MKSINMISTKLFTLMFINLKPYIHYEINNRLYSYLNYTIHPLQIYEKSPIPIDCIYSIIYKLLQ